MLTILSLLTPVFWCSFVPNLNPKLKELKMKKVLKISTLALLIAGVCHSVEEVEYEIHSDEHELNYFKRFRHTDYILRPRPEPPPHPVTNPTIYYGGLQDDTYWTGTGYYYNLKSYTTLGLLARRSDVIGVGVVSNRQDDRFTLTVDHALVGCTNGAVLVIHEGNDEPEEGIGDKNAFWPVNGSRIVVAAYTNDYESGTRFYWNTPKYPRPPLSIRPQLEIRFLNRSWWPVDRDDGVLFDQFTNVLQAVRFDRNWTNYFYLCRDGATNSPSIRVREDSHWDLRRLAWCSTDEQMQFILADPLVDQSHKNCLLSPGTWRIKPDIE